MPWTPAAADASAWTEVEPDPDSAPITDATVIEARTVFLAGGVSVWTPTDPDAAIWTPV